MRSLLYLVAGLMSCGLGGCVFSPDHMFGTEEHSLHPHPWHEWPAKIGMCVVGWPLMVIFSPLIVFEELTDSGSIMREGRPGVSSYVVGGPAIAAAYLVGLPFLVLGLPFEFGGSNEPAPEAENDRAVQEAPIPGKSR